MNKYIELQERQQREFDTFPMMFAFSTRQFEEGMKELGLTPNDTDKIYKAPGGGFYRRTDSAKLVEVINRHNREMQEAIAADKTGNDFIYEMFYYELCNHEYGYTGDLEDTLDALGYTWDQIEADSRLKHGLKKAIMKIKEEDGGEN